MVFKVFLKKISVFILFFLLIVKVDAQSLESYCEDGYYKIPNEPVCSRAPNCGGKSYEEVKNLPYPNPQACMGDKDGERAGCRGWVPLCCYEVARTGDFTKCVGYWERLWCAPVQCNQAIANGASDAQCGGSCLCGHAFKSYCGDKPVVPLDLRLEGKIPYGTDVPLSSPTATPTPIVPTLTFTPTSILSSSPTQPIVSVTPHPTLTPTTSIPPSTVVLSPTQSVPSPTTEKKKKFKFPSIFRSIKKEKKKEIKIKLPEIKVDKRSVFKIDYAIKDIRNKIFKIKKLDTYLAEKINFFIKRFLDKFRK